MPNSSAISWREKPSILLNMKIFFRLGGNPSIIVFPNEIKEPNRVIMEFSKIKKISNSDKIFIRNSETNEYSEQYKEITKVFYLNS